MDYTEKERKLQDAKNGIYTALDNVQKECFLKSTAIPQPIHTYASFVESIDIAWAFDFDMLDKTLQHIEALGYVLHTDAVDGFRLEHSEFENTFAFKKMSDAFDDLHAAVFVLDEVLRNVHLDVFVLCQPLLAVQSPLATTPAGGVA